MRAKARGFPTRFAPDAVVRHPARRSMADLRRQWDRHVSHHWSMQPKTVRGRAAWARARGGAGRLAGGGDPADPARPTAQRARGSGSTRCRGLVRLRLYRARRMLAELVDPAGRQRSTRWNRT